MSFAKPGDRIAVTGANGFVGQAMVEHLAMAGYDVVAISKDPEPAFRIRDFLCEYHCADLTRDWPTAKSVKAVVHLAGLAAVEPSFSHPQDYINVNSSIATNFFEYAVQQQWEGRVIVVSSGAVYGNISDPYGFTESSRPVASSPYVVSKLLTEFQSEYYAKRGVDAVVVRPLNHIGPGQKRGFIVPDLASKILELQPGDVLPVGNLNAERDYTDVRDVVRAYRFLLELDRPHHRIYNVCSGTTHSGWDVLESICEAFGRPIPTTKAVSARTLDPSRPIGCSDRLRIETGWTPEIKFERSIHDFTIELLS